jgi:hypothetical protein
MTEFASKRYFSKLNSLNDSPDAVSTSVVNASVSAIQTSTFILPLRATKSGEDENHIVRPADHKRPERSRLFPFRSKTSLYSKSITQPHDDFHSINSTDATATTRLPLDELFRSLPNELQIQIINSLPLSDILNLRRVSRSWHTLITLNEGPIVRYHLDHHIPAYALRLYPAPDPSKVDFHHLCSLWHRLHVAAKLSHLMCEWITKEIFLRTTKAQKQDFAPQQERMRRRLIPLLFTIFHFFETYRKLHLQYLAENDGYGLRQHPYTYNPIEAKIMSMYDDKTLLRVHQVFPLVISSFCRQLRPPSYAGRVERSLRGYLREKPPDEVHTAILCIGGLRQVERFWEISGYNSRRSAVDAWYSSITFAPDLPTRPKRSIMGIGRKKSMATLKKDGFRGMSSAAHPVPPVPLPLMATMSTKSFVFGTSLAAGMPMVSLPLEQTRQLLLDLPSLQQIWMVTAEALILDRKIVHRPQDILRNAQVMLELIREDGLEEEDEWWYGRNAPDSLRPLAETLDIDGTDCISSEV